MMQLIKIVWESVCRSIIRFFDNRFIPDNSIEYYRMEIDKLRLENKELQDRLVNVLMPKTPVEMNDEPVNWQPVSSFVPTHIRRQQLEQASLQRAKALAEEARKAMTTEELEKAVGI